VLNRSILTLTPQEIETAMGSRLTAEDEDDVERELAALEAEMTGAALPVVPTDALPEPATPAEPAAAAAGAFYFDPQKNKRERDTTAILSM
jgi:hypothetical protein